jgi:nucleotidyltransferase/DNA polymerase involved in DNA repair
MIEKRKQGMLQARVRLSTHLDALLQHTRSVRLRSGNSFTHCVMHPQHGTPLGAGLNKPDQQTVVPANAVEGLMRDLPVSKLRGLGGQLGQHVVSTLGISTCGKCCHI